MSKMINTKQSSSVKKKNEDNLIILKQHFELYDKYSQKFGKKIIILMEIGTFYEMRGSDENGECTGDHIRELAAKLNIKDYYMNNQCIPTVPSRTNPICLGFPNLEVSENNHIPKIVEAGFWVVIAKQKEISEKGAKQKKFERNVVRVINKATIMGETMNSKQNILVIYNEIVPLNGVHCIGMACLRVTSGKLNIYDGTSTLYEKTRTVEEMERWIHTHRPMQIIWINASDTENPLENLRNFLYTQNVLTYDDIPKFHNLLYQEQILRRYFPQYIKPEMVDIVDEFAMTYTPNARMSLMFLIQFLWDTNKDILHGMQRPEFENHQKSFILEKNAIKQLHIHEFCREIIKCQTQMGKELLRERMTRPSNDIETINEWLDFSADCDVRLRLSVVKKLQIVIRRMSTQRSSFRDLQYLWKNLHHLKNLPFSETMLQSPVFFRWNFDPILNYLEEMFDMEAVNDEELWIFKERLVEEQEAFKFVSETMRYFQFRLNDILGGDHIFFKETKLEGLVFLGNKSKVRSDLSNQTILFPKYNQSWNKETIKAKVISGKQGFVHSELSAQYVEMKDELQEKISVELRLEMRNIYDKFEELLHETLSNIAKLDVGMATNELAVKSKYVRPVLIDSSSSFFDAKNLRHPIIEKTLLNSTYVPNHFKLTDENPGLVIYGINSSGKSSAMRSVGISIVMAQAGLFVPASHFELAPFHNVLTRIMGGDDMMRGASSYTIEILECRPIATRATQNTLMLGDEIGHSTEVTSGSALVSALMDHMAEKKTKFLVATHMRALETLTDDKYKNAILYKHIHVGRDEDGNLVFDRVLRDGTGPDTYGLDIAEYLGMHPKIIFGAHKKIRKIKKYPNTLVENVSKYNSRKLHGPVCSTIGCENPMEEEDHDVPQYMADDNGFISGTNIHKHDPTNLNGLCKKCHRRKTTQDMKNLKRMRDGEVIGASGEEEQLKKKSKKIYEYMMTKSMTEEE